MSIWVVPRTLAAVLFFCALGCSVQLALDLVLVVVGVAYVASL